MRTLTSDASLSRACTSFVQDLAYATIPPAALDRAKLHVADLLACMIRGAGTTHAQPARDYARATGGAPQAALVGEKHKGPVGQAAFFNGYCGHIMEMDDVDRESITHPATVVIPAALAVGELRNASGRDLLTAVVAGYEVMLRIGAAVTPAHYAIWHTTGTAGAFGAAMAAGKLFGLVQPELDWALGNAGTMASGLWQFNLDGGMTKFLHAGRAAENGVLAAYLATRGFSGATRILEGKQGFFAGYARQNVNPAYFEDFGSRYRSAEVSIKPYPCCRHTHASIDAADAVRRQIGNAAIKSVRVAVYDAAIQVASNDHPATAQEAKFSLAFCAARTLLHGPLTNADFTAATLNDAATRALMAVTSVRCDPALDALMPSFWPSRVEVDCADGRTFAVQVDSPKGDPANPVGWREIAAKFDDLTEGFLSSAGRQELIDLCRNLEALPQADGLLDCINRHGELVGEA